MVQSASTSIGAFKSDNAKVRYMAAYDAVLRKWPVAYEERYVPTRLGVTHAIVSGPPDAPPLFLLHAFIATATVWRPNVEALSRHYRVYAVDVVGQAGKSVASRKINSRRDFADWLCDLLDALGIARTSIVGNSYGGFLAANQASFTPDRVDRVVLISPAAVFVSISRIYRAMFYLAILEGIARLWRKPRPPDITKYLGKNVQISPGDTEWVALGNLLISGTVRPNGIFPPVFPEAELRAIRSPTLLLIGEDETLYEPHATLKLARERMPSIEAQIVPNAHHFAAMARPNEVNSLIIEFLQRTANVSAGSR